MSEKLNELGVPPRFHAHAKHFASVFRDLGMTEAQIERAIGWGARYNGPPEALRAEFDSFCQTQGINPQLADLSESWLSQVNERGIESMPDVTGPAPSREADEQRLAEIREEMKKSDSRYEQDIDLRDEHLAILERMGQPQASVGKAPGPATTARLQEIRDFRRSNPDAYDSNAAMQREELTLLQGGPSAPAATNSSNMETNGE